MLQITIRPKDGFSSTTPWLRSVVKRVQKGLLAIGYDLDTDGYYGNGSAAVVKKFQEKAGLGADGIVGKNTWVALKPALEKAFGTVDEAIVELMPGFHGDLDWVHLQEGYVGKTYWPGGASGVTLDPGVDLGYADHFFVEKFYKDLMGEEQWAAVLKVIGVRGDAARDALNADEVLQSIRISSEKSDEAMPYAAAPYWIKISDRFPALVDEENPAPASVQTALLSLAYNRGAGNKGLNVLGDPLAAGDWGKVADEVAAMQQDHKLEGIRKRRRWEGALIKAELELA
ncbi:MAG: peptidoglycan-binding protein [Acidobacteriota bacterium]|nr:peptidoglycan-binding protein [Acidobacteriota bacterium]